MKTFHGTTMQNVILYLATILNVFMVSIIRKLAITFKEQDLPILMNMPKCEANLYHFYYLYPQLNIIY